MGRINTNVASLYAQQGLGNAQLSLNKSLQRLERFWTDQIRYRL